MPYDIRKDGSRYAIVKQDTGEVVGHSDTRKMAEASVRARYMGESKSSKHSPGMMSGGKMLDDTYTPRPITHAYVDGKRHPVA